MLVAMRPGRGTRVRRGGAGVRRGSPFFGVCVVVDSIYCAARRVLRDGAALCARGLIRKCICPALERGVGQVTLYMYLLGMLRSYKRNAIKSSLRLIFLLMHTCLAGLHLVVSIRSRCDATPPFIYLS